MAIWITKFYESNKVLCVYANAYLHCFISLSSISGPGLLPEYPTTVCAWSAMVDYSITGPKNCHPYTDMDTDTV